MQNRGMYQLWLNNVRKISFYKQWNLEHPNIDIIGWIEKDWISWFVVCVKKSIYGDAQPTTNNRFAPHMFWTQKNYHKILLRVGQLDINICRILLLSVNSTSWILIYINACEQVNWTVCDLVSIYFFSEFSSWSKMSWQQRQSALKWTY